MNVEVRGDQDHGGSKGYLNRLSYRFISIRSVVAKNNLSNVGNKLAIGYYHILPVLVRLLTLRSGLTKTKVARVILTSCYQHKGRC